MQATTEGVGKPQESLSRRLAIQEHRRQKALHALARLRKEASEEIARLIAFLDASDPYVMTEPEDDDDREEVGDSEPSLGSFDRMTNQEKSWRRLFSEFIAEVDAELDQADDEPSLGAAEHHPITPWSGMANRPGEFLDTSGSQAF
jgi:hypothetical protein